MIGRTHQQHFLPDEPWLDELRDPSLVPPEIRRAAVAWYARVEPTPVHRA